MTVTMAAMTTTQYASPVSRLYHGYYLKKHHQIGRGGGQFGQIYQGQRFPGLQQDGRGIGSFLGTIARGVANMIAGTPQWVKSGAKIVGKSALQGLADYAGDVQAGVPANRARKRALQSTLSNVLIQGGKKLKQQEGGKRRRRRRRQRKTKGRRRQQVGGAACCKIKPLKKRRRRQQIGGKKTKKRKPAKHSRRRKGVFSKRKHPAKQRRRPIKRRTKFDLFSV